MGDSLSYIDNPLIGTHGLCISAPVLYQLSYEDRYVGSTSIYLSQQSKAIPGAPPLPGNTD